MEPLITCTNVCKCIRQFHLEGIEFSLEPGYILGVIGRNGAGKSTLVQLILGGYYMDTVGTPQMNDEDIVIDGFSMRYRPNEAKQRLAYVLGDCPFSMVMSGLENARLYGACYDRWQQDVFLKKSEKFGLDLSLPLKKLSKGECILYQLAFALAYDAKLYVMDEPTANLDVSYRQLLLDTMQELVEGGEKSVIYVTHFLEDLEQIGDYILWIEEGQQVLFGEKEELLNSYSILTGTEKQFRYIEQVKPDAFLATEYQPHASQGLVRGTGKELPLRLDIRRPTLEELLFYYHIHYKKHKMNLFGQEDANSKPRKKYQFKADKEWESRSQEERAHFESPFD